MPNFNDEASNGWKVVSGYLGNDPVLRTTATGKEVCSFRVAVNEGKGNDKKAIWWNISVWEDLGVLVADQFKKRDAIMLIGPSKSREFNGEIEHTISAYHVAIPIYKKKNNGGDKMPF